MYVLYKNGVSLKMGLDKDVLSCDEVGYVLLSQGEVRCVEDRCVK